MQFIRSRIAAPRPSQSGSTALWKQLGWFSASKPVLLLSSRIARPRSKLKQVIFSRKIDFDPSLRAVIPAILRDKQRCAPRQIE